MKRPSAPGTVIDDRRYKRWTDRFGSYRDGVINVTIQSWLNQFDAKDQDMAARVLDSIDFYGQSQIHAAYSEALATLAPHGWHKDPQRGGVNGDSRRCPVALGRAETQCFTSSGLRTDLTGRNLMSFLFH